MNQRTAIEPRSGRMLFGMLDVFAHDAERGLLLERQREGVAKAKADGKYWGGKPTARAKAAEVLKLNGEGLQRTEIARRLEIGVAGVGLSSAGRCQEGDRRCESGGVIRPCIQHVDWLTTYRLNFIDRRVAENR